jgi:hypothetical protein
VATELIQSAPLPQQGLSHANTGLEGVAVGVISRQQVCAADEERLGRELLLAA